MHVKKITKEIGKLVEHMYAKGADGKAIALALIEAGGVIMGTEENVVEFIGHFNTEGFALTIVAPNDRTVVIPKITNLIGHEDQDAPYPPMTRVRVEELLHYASCYGEYDENTPNGTPSSSDVGNGMNDYRRAAIVLLKKVLGFLPEDYQAKFPIADVDVMRAALKTAGDQFLSYQAHHAAKQTPESDEKARINGEKAEMCFNAASNAAGMPEIAPQAAQEAVSVPVAPVEAASLTKVSDAPLDRTDMLAWLDMKIEGCTTNGMPEAFEVLKALRGELAQHLEAAPTDIYRALTEIIRGIGSYNVAKGWWNDANTDLRTCEHAPYVMASKMFLVVTEMSEAMEGHRKSSKASTLPDDHLPEFPMVAVEFADALIRLFDLGANYRLPNGQTIDVPAAVVAKLAYNDKREDHKKEVREQAGGKSI